MSSDLSVELETACKHLSEGRCVVIPTETVYGLAGDATNGIAVARIFEIKGRPSFNPLICHVNGLKMAKEYGEFEPLALMLADAFWPGPMTLVVPVAKNSSIHPLVTAGLETIGLRHPAGIASELISKLGKPLAAPSANRSGKVSPTTAQHVRDQFPDKDLYILDDGPCSVGLESTILKVENGRIVILRPGAITEEMIENATGVEPEFHKGENIEAPGMMRSHYAPNAKLVLNCTQCDDEDAWLQFGDCAETEKPHLNLSRDSNLLEASANLYSHLIELDRHSPGSICVSPIPMEGLGVAINDRLARAAAPRDGS